MQRGQALIVVLMVLAVVSAVGLSVASRSITEVNISSVQEESSRALSAAEAGIEAALSGPVTVGSQIAVGSGATGSTYQPESIVAGTAQQSIDLGTLRSGESVTVFLADDFATENPIVPGFTSPFQHNDSIDICFGDNSLSQNPAIEITLYYYDGANYRTTRTGADPSGSSGLTLATQNSGANDCPGTVNYKYWVKNATFTNLGLPTGNIPLLLRLKLLYNNTQDHFVGVGANSGAPPFPGQGREITISGQAGSTTRRVQVFEMYAQPAEIFDNALFAGGGSIQ